MVSFNSGLTEIKTWVVRYNERWTAKYIKSKSNPGSNVNLKYVFRSKSNPCMAWKTCNPISHYTYYWFLRGEKFAREVRSNHVQYCRQWDDTSGKILFTNCTSGQLSSRQLHLSTKPFWQYWTTLNKKELLFLFFIPSKGHFPTSK